MTVCIKCIHVFVCAVYLPWYIVWWLLLDLCIVSFVVLLIHHLLSCSSIVFFSNWLIIDCPALNSQLYWSINFSAGIYICSDRMELLLYTLLSKRCMLRSTCESENIISSIRSSNYVSVLFMHVENPYSTLYISLLQCDIHYASQCRSFIWK